MNQFWKPLYNHSSSIKSPEPITTCSASSCEDFANAVEDALSGSKD